MVNGNAWGRRCPGSIIGTHRKPPKHWRPQDRPVQGLGGGGGGGAKFMNLAAILCALCSDSVNAWLFWGEERVLVGRGVCPPPPMAAGGRRQPLGVPGQLYFCTWARGEKKCFLTLGLHRTAILSPGWGVLVIIRTAKLRGV